VTVENRQIIVITAADEITVGTHRSGTVDVTVQDPRPDGSRVVLAFDGDDVLRKLVEVAVAHLRAGDPPREPSATHHPQGTVIPGGSS
jgi:hypothetical protein